MSPKTKQQFTQIREGARQNILSAALKLFSKNGYSSTSIRNIAKAADISDGLLYRYFNSKEELAIEVFKSAFTTLDQTIVALEKNKPEESIKSSISNFIALLQNELDKIRLLAQMGLQKEKFELLNKLTVAKYEQSVQKFTRNFKEIGMSNPEIEASFLVATLDGIMFEMLLMDKPFDLNNVENNLINKYCS
jgi:AcrR family transcriptional regulator